MKKILLTLFLFGLLVNSVLIAQTRTFNLAGQWHVAGNWAGSAPPTRYCQNPKYQHWETETIIDANADLTETAYNTCDLFQYEPHNAVTINAGKTLTIGGVWTNFYGHNDAPLTVNGTFRSTTGANLTFNTLTIGSSGVLDIGSGDVDFNSAPTNNGIIKGTASPLIATNLIIGGTIQPGNSVGTLITQNNIGFNGTVQIEVNNGSSYDVITSQNSANLTVSSATVQFIFNGTNYFNQQTFQVFTNFGSVTAPGSITNNNGYTIIHNGGGQFKITAGALPVELISFHGSQITSQTVRLDWRTASESNNEGFQIQRSLDGEKWEDLSFTPGNGTTTETHDYSFLDEKPLPGTNYYRLRQVDFDGGEEYSKVVSVKVGSPTNSLTFFPNPAPEGITSLYFPEAPEGEGLLEVFDWLGNKVHRQAVLLEGGSEVLVPVDLHSFPAGMYVATLAMGGKVFSEKLVLKQ